MDSSETALKNIDLDKLRHKLRENKLAEREKQRNTLMKKIRFVEDIQPISNITTEELMELTKKLIRKSQITCEILHAIMNTLLDSRENMEAFMSIDGALQALLRCLSGQNEKFQLFAACCICNLALANERIAYQVLKASDSYLFAHLSGRNCYVIEACAIALGNFSSHGTKHIQLILAQGFFSIIQKILRNCDKMLESSCIYALTHLVYKGFDILRDEDIKCAMDVVIAFIQNKFSTVIFLLSVLSSHRSTHHTLLFNCVHIQTLQNLLISLHNNEKESVYYLRVLNNCFCQESGQMALVILQEHSSTFLECVKLLLISNVKYLKKECMATIGILINHPHTLISEFGLEVTSRNLKLIQEYLLSNKHEIFDK